MGKGKKGQKGKAPESGDAREAMAALTISPPEPMEEEASEGLTGGAKERRQKKKDTKAKLKAEVKQGAEQNAPEPSTSAATSVEPSAGTSKESSKDSSAITSTATKMQTDDNDDEDILGLGVTSAKRSRRRKPKVQDEVKREAEPAPPSFTSAQMPTPVSTSQAAEEPFGARPPGPQQGTPWGARAQPPQAMAQPRAQPPQEMAQARGAIPQQGKPGAAQGSGPAKQLPSVASSIYSIPAKIIGQPAPGKQIQVLCNYLPLKIKNIKVQRYDVTVTPDKPRKFMNSIFFTMIKKYFPKSVVAYDQRKIAFALEKLPGINADDKLSYEVDFVDDNRKPVKYVVQLKEAGIVDFNTLFNYMKNGGSSMSPPTEAIQCVDVILRQGVLEKYTKVNRTFFMRPENPVNLTEGLEMWTGIFQSALFTSRPFINLDVVHKAFPKRQSMIEVLKEFNFEPTQTLQDQRRGNLTGLKNFLKGIKLVANIGGDTSQGAIRREFIYADIVGPPSKVFFPPEDENKTKKISVAQYFLSKNCRLKYPNLNCLWVGPRDKTIYYPIEFLEVPYGQVINKQLTDRQLSTMVREAATAPSIRKGKIEEIIKKMNYKNNPYFGKFGLEISENFAEVPAKVLAPPMLEYQGQRVTPRNGQWNYNRLLQSARLQRWGIIAITIDARAANAEAGVKMIQSCAKDVGIEMAECSFARYNVPLAQIELALRDALDQQLQLVFVVVPMREIKNAYCQLKQFAERRVGVLTQCIKESTMTRMNTQIARNILLKVNSKLMGINQALDPKCLPRCLQGGKVMVVGADVTHPTPDQTKIPSIAAVTASIDTKCFIYNIGLSIQASKQEMIMEFEDMMLEHLKVYRSRQGYLPQKIFVFRDGVSEGQFSQVMQNELRAIYQAYATLTGGQGRPEVLFLLVQKRHHTRLFSKDKVAMNVEPGTVVDKEIVHPRELDFYLVSHQAIKGTARPTRYHAVCNDGGIGAEEVEQMAFYLCHLYSRCSRSVSYPTPTYYAHLACLRARVLTHGEELDANGATKRLNVLERMLNNSRMFFV